jgi:hypothetical protein
MRRLIPLLIAALFMTGFPAIVLGQANPSGEASTTKPPAAKIELPAPEPGRGHAHGVMLLKGEPRKGIPVYLHQIDPDQQGSEPVTHTDEHGAWVALNVKPAKYITTAFRLDGAPMIYYPDSVHEVKAGGVTDFGQDNTQRADGFD